MWLVWSVTGFAAALAAGCVLMLREDLRRAPPGWRALAWSGITLALGGLGFIVRFWEPAPGPYRANVLYPLGPYLNAWAVSFGFMWLAFGVVFYALALRASRTWGTWWLLVVAWFLAWLPHGIIGIGFALAGSNEASIRLYREWASAWPGLIRLCASAVILLAHFGLAGVGFVATGRALRAARDAEARPPRSESQVSRNSGSRH